MPCAGGRIGLAPPAVAATVIAMFTNPGAAIAVAISFLALLGGVVGWLLVDAREKARSLVLDALGAEVRDDVKRQSDRLTALEVERKHLDEKISRLDRDKADRAVLQAVSDSLNRIDNHLTKLDEKIDSLRGAA